MAILDERFLDGATDVSNPELVAAMYKVVEEDSPEHRRALYRALLDSRLILPAPAQSNVAQGNLQLLAYENKAGEPIFVAFTDEEAVLAWQPEGMDFIAMRAADLFRLAEQNQMAAVLLNPAGPVGGRVLRSEFTALAKGQLPFAEPLASEAIEAGTTVLIGKPRNGPSKAWERALRRALHNRPQIAAAYVFALHRGDGDPRTVVGLVFEGQPDPEARRDMIHALLADLAELGFEGETLDVIVLEDNDFLQVVRDTVEPLYERSG